MTHFIEEVLQFMKIKRKSWKDIMKVELCGPKNESTILALEKLVKLHKTQIWKYPLMSQFFVVL